MTGRILLIRHTRLAVAPGVCYGRADIPLAPTFAAEAVEVLARMPWTPAEIWTSPAVRCMRLADAFGIPAKRVRVDSRLLELDFGEWENRAWESFRSPQSEAWARDPLKVRPPGGETAAELHLRVGQARDELLARVMTEENLRVAVITHAGVIRSWRAHASGRSLADFFGEPVPHGQPIGIR
ncbi:MAG: histidine phosphatase family protein [Candidatus Accumulibacter sp.]|jgi:alpha-ribazole phosphatase|nr:histidine phosphatase family protein [Accumulibacter sp.]